MSEEEKVPVRQLILVGIAVLLTGILLIVKPSHSVFQVNKTINIMDAKVGDFGNPTKTVKSGDLWVDYDKNMIPVAFDNSGQTVRADETNTDSTYYWFDYCQNTSSGSYNYKASGCEFRWANAVLVSDTNRETYKSASPGTLITESDILAYLVYVPRFKYQLWNANDGTSTVQTINIEFENKTTTPSCGGNACTTNRIYKTGSNGLMLTHPAFTFGTTELNGLWVGKFEVSPDEASACYTESSPTNCSDTAGTAITPRIKPNKKSWIRANIATLYTVSQYFKSKPMYGIDTSTVDSHMMKNMEWGAVAYLSQSIYGKRGYDGTEIYANPSSISDYVAGRGAVTPSGGGGMYSYDGKNCNIMSGDECAGMQQSVYGMASSTTGTIYGIYDMSGGTFDHVMGNMVDSIKLTAPGPIYSNASGFDGTTYKYPESKYYDSYDNGTTYNDATAFARGYLGDATKETLTCLNSSECGWNSNMSVFVGMGSFCWFLRGGLYAGAPQTLLGVWSFTYSNNGGGPVMGSFRPTLVVE